MPSLAERFWSKVDIRGADECWPWKKGLSTTGHGKFGVAHSKTVSAHRFAWILTNGPLSPDLLVCHRCDNPPCCNPSHLFVGTHLDNMLDMKQKNRSRGRKAGRSGRPRSLTDDAVRSIRSLHAAGTKQTAIAALFNVNPVTISQIVRGVSYTSVP